MLDETQDVAVEMIIGDRAVTGHGVEVDDNTWQHLLVDAVAAVSAVHRLLGRAGEGRVEDLDGFDEGAWWVQDAAAALPVKLFGDVAGLTVLDLCAAPGRPPGRRPGDRQSR